MLQLLGIGAAALLYFQLVRNARGRGNGPNAVYVRPARNERVAQRNGAALPGADTLGYPGNIGDEGLAHAVRFVEVFGR